MLSGEEFLQWCGRLSLSPEAQAVVAMIRSVGPTRRVGGGRENVSGRYPSRKMGVTIQFESHRVELAFVYEMEHDPDVLEYYDQAPSILLDYQSANRTAAADMAGCGRGVLYSWFKGDQVPRIDTLLRTLYQLQLPVACLVDGAYPGLTSEGQAKRSLEIMSIRESAPKRSPEQIHRALEAALREEPPPSLNEVARRLGYGTTTRVRSVNRDLCAQIVLKHRKSGRSHWWMRRGAKPICELSQIRQVLEGYLASDGPIPPLDRIAASPGYAVDGSLRQKCPELCGALSARIAEQKRLRMAAIEPALERALEETPVPSLRQMAKRLGFSAQCVLKAHAPALYEKLKARWRVSADACQAELGTKLAAVLEENPPPSLRSVYSRFCVTESIVNTTHPHLRREIGLRHKHYRRQQAQARRDAVRAEIREIVQMLHAQGICPSVPRVTSQAAKWLAPGMEGGLQGGERCQGCVVGRRMRFSDAHL